MPDQGPQLRGIHVPHISMWWPWAPGWWMLLALMAIGLLVLVVALRRRKAWRRHVDATLAGLHAAVRTHGDDGDTAAFAATASQLVRRVARSRDARSITLSGQAWRDALAAMASRQDVSRIVALDTAMYRRNAPLDVPATAQDVEAWVREAMHRSSMPRARRARGHAVT